jgi:hypothetical protein
LHGVLGLAEHMAELKEGGGAFGGDAAGVQGSEESARGVLVIRFGGSRAGDGSEFAEEIVLARGARGEGAVGVAESVKIAMSE